MCEEHIFFAQQKWWYTVIHLLNAHQGETQHSGPLEESGGFRLATPEVVGFVVRPPSQDAAVVANEGCLGWNPPSRKHVQIH